MRIIIVARFGLVVQVSGQVDGRPADSSWARSMHPAGAHLTPSPISTSGSPTAAALLEELPGRPCCGAKPHGSPSTSYHQSRRGSRIAIRRQPCSRRAPRPGPAAASAAVALTASRKEILLLQGNEADARSAGRSGSRPFLACGLQSHAGFSLRLDLAGCPAANSRTACRSERDDRGLSTRRDQHVAGCRFT